MSDERWLRSAVAAVLVLATPLLARAQIYDAVGSRAQGMGGAFVAVADDASATWWNPAGLAGGAYFSGVLDIGLSQDPRSEPAAVAGGPGAWRSGTWGVAVGFPALGLSYYRLRFSEMQPPSSTAGRAGSRQDLGPEGVRLLDFSAGEFGITVGQSLGDHLVVATTVKLVRGGIGSASVAGSSASLDAAGNLETRGATRGDLDLGAMASFGGWKIGAALKNATRPSFDNDSFFLERQGRAGVSYTGGPIGRVDGYTVALDADLTRTPTADGDVRHAGAGVEAWFAQRKFALRVGTSLSTIDAARPVATGGASAAIKSGVYVDGFAVVGADDARKGYGLALRLTF